MQFLAVVIFLLISAFGIFILKRKRNNKKGIVWLARIHGAAGLIGLFVLFIGLMRGYWSDWGWVSLGLFGVFIFSSFLLFEKVFKNAKAPTFIIAVHGLAAIFCTGVLTYSLILTN